MANYVDYDNAVELFTEVGNKRKASESMQESLLKSTVGWTGKNLLKNTASSQTINGVTFTVNADGSVTTNGTATTEDATFIIFQGTIPPFNGFVLNGCPLGGALSKYLIGYTKKTSPYTIYGLDTGNGVTISIPSGHENDDYFIYIRIKNGQTVDGLTFYPMVRDASITDDTYEPYHPPVSDWGYTQQEANVLGAKQWFFDEVYGLAFNSDTIGANTIISIAHSSFIAKVDKNTDYTISREGGNRFRVGLSTAFPANNVSCNLLVNDPDMKSFTFNSGNYEYVMAWMENATDTAENIKPLCTLASDTDRTYKKFAMTNRELTEEKLSISELKTIASSATDFAAFKTAIANL